MIEEIEAKIQETIEADDDEQQVIRKAQTSQATKTPAKSKRNYWFLVSLLWFFSFLMIMINSETAEAASKEIIG